MARSPPGTPHCLNSADRLNGSRYPGIAPGSQSLEAVLLQAMAASQTAAGGDPPVGPRGIHREYVQADPHHPLTDGTPRRPHTRQTSTTPVRTAGAATGRCRRSTATSSGWASSPDPTSPTPRTISAWPPRAFPTKTGGMKPSNSCTAYVRSSSLISKRSTGPCLTVTTSTRVDAGRVHRNPDLAGTRMRIGEIHDLEDLRPPEPVETDCLHHSLRSRPPGVVLAAPRL